MAALAVVLIVVFVVHGAMPALLDVGPARFLTDRDWRPVSEGRFGVMPLLVGSLLVTGLAMAIAAPIGVLTAIFTRHYAPPPAAAALHRITELLNGVPSVLFGLWGLVELTPIIHRMEPPGQSLLAGAVVLALMILPTVILTAAAALAAVPREHLVAAAALGVGRFTTIRRIALPTARPAIAAGLLLGAARAIGETMAVLMVCGNIVQVPGSVFEPIRTVTANIALEMGYATADHRSALFVTGLLLMMLVGALLLVREAVARDA